MSGLRIEHEWLGGEFLVPPEDRATYARMSIVVADQDARSVRHSVFAPLYPLAEWIAANWFALQSESPPVRTGRQASYRRSHDLANAGGGFAWPSLTLNPIGDFTQLQWHPREVGPIRYLSEGEAVVRTTALLTDLARFVEAVLRRLDESGVGGTVLHREWEMIGGLAPDEREFCGVAASLGMDPFDPDEATTKALLEAESALSTDFAREVCAVSDVASFAEDCRQAKNALDAARATRSPVPALREIASSLRPRPSQEPWVQGYALARALRRHLGLAAKVRNWSVGQIAEVMGLPMRAIALAEIGSPWLGGVVERLNGDVGVLLRRGARSRRPSGSRGWSANSW